MKHATGIKKTLETENITSLDNFLTLSFIFPAIS